jgi:NhaP-type Na+/H+ or K+/H+ antiporter
VPSVVWALGAATSALRERGHEYHGPVHEGASVVEKVGEFALILLLGSTVTFAGLAAAGVAGWVLAVVLLLAIRPIAVLLSFIGSRLHRREKLFIGWFGVRGIGSFYYVAVAIGAGVLGADEAMTIYWTVIVCVGLSIVVHGLSGAPVTRRTGLEPP